MMQLHCAVTAELTEEMVLSGGCTLHHILEQAAWFLFYSGGGHLASDFFRHKDIKL